MGWLGSFAFAAIVMYVGSRMTPRERTLFKAFFVLVFVLPMTILLWYVGAWQMVAQAAWTMISAVVSLVLLLIQTAVAMVLG